MEPETSLAARARRPENFTPRLTLAPGEVEQRLLQGRLRTVRSALG
jgi:hypothetical protein